MDWATGSPQTKQDKAAGGGLASRTYCGHLSELSAGVF